MTIVSKYSSIPYFCTYNPLNLKYVKKTMSLGQKGFKVPSSEKDSTGHPQQLCDQGLPHRAASLNL